MNQDILEKAKKYVNNLLMPLEDHYYHQYDHALEVMQRSIYLGTQEGVSEEEKELLALAGIFHDTGFIIQYDKNEPFGAKITHNFLKSVLYPNDKIELIESLILATDPEYKNPKNILEKIIKDADLDNLGTQNFFDKGEKLKNEIETIKQIKIKDPNWHHSSIDLLHAHNYYTKTQQQERGEQKEKNMSILEDMLNELDREEKLSLQKFL
ncbi:HD domain-containing protein [Candidatus Gracilibacteria bacterium]|nr:HD domain-containing protein [Candidatus Gracilibacteria bacterium]